MERWYGKILNLCQNLALSRQAEVISGKGTYDLNKNGEDKFILDFENIVPKLN